MTSKQHLRQSRVQNKEKVLRPECLNRQQKESNILIQNYMEAWSSHGCAWRLGVVMDVHGGLE